MARVVGEPVETNEQQVGELGRDHVRAGAIDRRGHEFLGEERIALGAVDDSADVLLGHRLGVERSDERAYLVLIEWRQVQARDSRQPSTTPQPCGAADGAGADRRCDS